MKILFVHNNYGNNNSGEEHAAQSIAELLLGHGHEVRWYRRSSDELNSRPKKAMAFFTGVWNPVAVKELSEIIEDFHPDIIQLQNLYPLISPAIINLIKSKGIPIVMRCPNYRLFCPSGLHLNSKGEICEKCLSVGKEMHCILNNCEGNIIKSTGYALRNFTARSIWNLYNNVDIYIVQSEFQKDKFVLNGLPGSKIVIVPGLTPEVENYTDYKLGDVVSFIGRASKEKGIEEFVESARKLPEIQFAVAGNIDPSMENVKLHSPENVEWKGFLEEKELNEFYRNSRIIVVPGKWYEGFPNVITRAMIHGKPVISSDLGAMASIIDHENNGLLVAPGDVDSLAGSIKALYSDTDKCKNYGLRGKEKAEKEYSSEKIYQKLLKIYNSLS